MATPEYRRDAYGKPIPPLVDAEHELRYERAFNKQQRKLIFEEMEKIYRALLRRDITAVVTIRFGVKNGIILGKFFTDAELCHTGPQLPDEVHLQEFEDSMLRRGVPDDVRQQQIDKRKKQRFSRHASE